MRRLILAAAMLFSGAVMLYFLLAGASKLAALDIAIEDLAAFDVLAIPTAVLGPLVLILSALEVVVPLAWLSPTLRRHAQIGAILLLGAFILMLTIQLRFSNPPRCGCLGLLQKFQSLTLDARGALARAWLLLGLAVTGAVLHRLLEPTTEKGVPS